MGTVPRRLPSGVRSITISSVRLFTLLTTSTGAGVSAMYKVIRYLLRTIARVINVNFHENFHMTEALISLYEDGMMARASGFVFDAGDEILGLYVIRYKSNITDNIGGRWN